MNIIDAIANDPNVSPEFRGALATKSQTARWRTGPPPSIGWWTASTRRDLKILRWWDGQRWSDYAVAGDSEIVAAMAAKYPAWTDNQIEWTDIPASWEKTA